MSGPAISRRAMLRGLAVSAPMLATGCVPDEAHPAYSGDFLSWGEYLSYRASRIFGGQALAREYPPEAMSPVFRANGSTNATMHNYFHHHRNDFVNWRLTVDGLVERPLKASLDQLKAMPSRTQITRHDCVEGWSAIGQWTGVPLRVILDRCGLQDDARYIVFYCHDKLGPWQYYESIDLHDAYHPQTILAYGMNGTPLPRRHGAPLRLRVERQLGYKHAKFLHRVQAVASLADIGEGKGGFWEDIANYEWYAGI